MCLAVYIASSIGLPTTKWNESVPAFYLETVPLGENVRKQFSLPNVYYVGSHEGCGCGFFKEGEADEELEIHQSNYASLARCIRSAQEKGAELELFACWEGDQGSKPEFVESTTATELENPAYQFKEKLFIHVRKSATGRGTTRYWS